MTVFDQLMAFLSHANLVRKTFLAFPPRWFRCRRTLEPGEPTGSIVIESAGRPSMSTSSIRVSFFLIWSSPLLAVAKPVANLLTL